MITLIHRHTSQAWQVKVTGCKHYMVRQVYRDCSGVKHTDWRRVRKATVDQLERECVSNEKV